MAEAFRTWSTVLVATVGLLPVAGLTVALLASWRRRRGWPSRRAWRTAALDVGMVAGTLPWVWMVLTPGAGSRGVELVPGQGLVDVLAADTQTTIVQVGGNLLVFAAFGFLAPLRWGIGVLTVAACAAAGSVTVELLQYVLHLHRVSSVDDVALNTLGAAAAAGAARLLWAARRRTAERASRRT